MIPTDSQTTLPSDAKEKPKRRRSKLLGMFMIVMMLASGVAVIAIWRNVKGDEEMPRTSYQGAVQTPVVDTASRSLQEIEKKFVGLEERVAGLSQRVDKLEQGGANAEVNVEKPAATVASDAEVGKLKDELSTLTMAFGDVRAQVQQSIQAADKTRFADQASLATVVAFTQLRQAADDGQNFKPEYDALYAAASRDAGLREVIAKLGPVAATGAPSLEVLRDEFAGLMPAAQTAAKRAQAQGWKDRVTVELQSLVSVRPLHPAATADGGLDGIQNDLMEHRISAAIEKINLLPETAQAVLKEWRGRIEARQQLDDAMKAVTAKLIEQKPVADVPAAATLPEPATVP